MNNREFLQDEYSQFYSKFYGITGDHTSAVDVICEIRRNIKDKSSTILEYGCATGFNLKYFQLEGFTDLWGIDGYEKFIEIANSEKSSVNFHHCNFALDDFKISIKYDIIFTRGVLQQGRTQKEKIKNNDDNVKRILSTCRDAIKETGTIILAEGKVREWEQLASAAGLEVSRQKILNDHQICFLKRRN